MVDRGQQLESRLRGQVDERPHRGLQAFAGIETAGVHHAPPPRTVWHFRRHREVTVVDAVPRDARVVEPPRREFEAGVAGVPADEQEGPGATDIRQVARNAGEPLDPVADPWDPPPQLHPRVDLVGIRRPGVAHDIDKGDTPAVEGCQQRERHRSDVPDRHDVRLGRVEGGRQGPVVAALDPGPAPQRGRPKVTVGVRDLEVAECAVRPLVGGIVDSVNAHRRSQHGDVVAGVAPAVDHVTTGELVAAVVVRRVHVRQYEDLGHVRRLAMLTYDLETTIHVRRMHSSLCGRPH